MSKRILLSILVVVSTLMVSCGPSTSKNDEAVDIDIVEENTEDDVNDETINTDESEINESTEDEVITENEVNTEESEKEDNTKETEQEDSSNDSNGNLNTDLNTTALEKNTMLDSESESNTNIDTIDVESETNQIEEDINKVYTGPIESCDLTKYPTAQLNVRKGPGTEWDKLGYLQVNEAVRCIGKCDNGWYKVEYKEEDGFVSGKYLSDKKVEVPEINTDTTGLVFDGNVSQACKNKALELYSYVPSSVKQAIVNKGYQVIVSSNSAWTDGHAGTYYPTGYSGWQGRAIAIYAGSVGKVNMAVIHEIGHFIDDYCGNRDGHGYNTFGFRSASASAEFQEIFRSEVGASGFPSWATDCYEDYFAEVYWKALTNPGWCQRTIPRSYEFVMRQSNSI